MNVVIWARVSSTEQKEGYSIDAQLRATRQKAEREHWQIVREFSVAESAKRGADRASFNGMLKWVKRNVRRLSIGAILSHKLDRACRNMRDAVRLQGLEDECGVRLCFVDNQFGEGPAGALSFNVMAAVAQYYSDNLRQETMKGMEERVRQGWIIARAPYGYVNVRENREEPIQVDTERAHTVLGIFDMYSRGNMTFQSLADRLHSEGHVYRPSQTRFSRKALSYILNNRFYIGEIQWHGKTYRGKHHPLIDQRIFETCQDILKGKNRRGNNADLPLAGGLFTCAYCGSLVTGERIRRRLKDGDVREHIYYRCANNAPGPEHPIVRWREDDLEDAIIKDLASLQMPSKEIAEWFRRTLAAALGDVVSAQKRQRKALAKRRTELKAMQEKALNAYLAGIIDEETFRLKSAEFKGALAEVETSLHDLEDMDSSRSDIALRALDWSQRLADIWRGSKIAVRNEILETVSLNRTLSDVSLCTEKRKPFDILAKRPILKDGTPNCRNFEPVVTAYVEVFARPEADLVALDRLARQCA